MDIKTGLVIDYISLSKYCHACVLAEKAYGTDSEEFGAWFDVHKESGTSNKNYEGSSNAMEMAGALKLWKRSISECQMRYVTMLSDGDSKTHAHLVDNDPYSGVPILKEECINHVSKRISASLKKLVSENKVKGITLGGAGAGQLTENVIMKLASYYRKALESAKGNTTQMKKNELATLYHCASTDKKPNHKYCPTGESSWCFYKKALATKTKKKRKSHNEMSLKLNEKVFKAMLPVYTRLTDDELLKRCCSGKTQNVNESIHSVMWHKCPKEVFVSKRRIDIAMLYAAAQFNMGRSASLHLRKQSLGETVAGASAVLAQKKDKKILQNSVAALATSTPHSRERLKPEEKEKRRRKPLQKKVSPTCT